METYQRYIDYIDTLKTKKSIDNNINKLDDLEKIILENIFVRERLLNRYDKMIEIKNTLPDTVKTQSDIDKIKKINTAYVRFFFTDKEEDAKHKDEFGKKVKLIYEMMYPPHIRGLNYIKMFEVLKYLPTAPSYEEVLQKYNDNIKEQRDREDATDAAITARRGRQIKDNVKKMKEMKEREDAEKMKYREDAEKNKPAEDKFTKEKLMKHTKKQLLTFDSTLKMSMTKDDMINRILN